MPTSPQKEIIIKAMDIKKLIMLLKQDKDLTGRSWANELSDYHFIQVF